MSKKSSLFIIFFAIILSIMIMLSSSSVVKEKAATEFIIFTTNLPDSPVKDVYIKHVKKNLSSFLLIPAIKIEIRNEKRAANAINIIHNAFHSYPLPPKLLNALIENIDNEDPVIRGQIIDILGESQSPKAFKAILGKAENDKDINMQAYAIITLGNFNYPSVQKFLEVQLESEDPRIQAGAAQAFSILVSRNKILVDDRLNRKFIDFLYNTDKHETARDFIMDTLSQCNKEKFIQIILPLLKDKSRPIKMKASLYLGFRGKRSDVNLITPYLSDPDKETVKVAEQVILNIKKNNPLPSPTPHPSSPSNDTSSSLPPSPAKSLKN